MLRAGLFQIDDVADGVAFSRNWREALRTDALRPAEGKFALAAGHGAAPGEGAPAA